MASIDSEKRNSKKQQQKQKQKQNSDKKLEMFKTWWQLETGFLENIGSNSTSTSSTSSISSSLFTNLTASPSDKAKSTGQMKMKEFQTHIPLKTIFTFR